MGSAIPLAAVAIDLFLLFFLSLPLPHSNHGGRTPELGNFPDADGASDHEREERERESGIEMGLFMCNVHGSERYS